MITRRKTVLRIRADFLQKPFFYKSWNTARILQKTFFTKKMKKMITRRKNRTPNSPISFFYKKRFFIKVGIPHGFYKNRFLQRKGKK